MSVNIADIQKSIEAEWNSSTLDTTFKALWSDSSETEFPVLNDQEALGDQPWPYVVMDELSQDTTDRMSGGSNALREVRDADVRFNIHAKDISGDSRTSKEIAAYLAEEIMKVFGGHPTQAATAEFELDNGNVLFMELDRDFGLRTGDAEYQWVLVYRMLVDVPVMA